MENWWRCCVAVAVAAAAREAATARPDVWAELAASDLQSRRPAAGVAVLMTAVVVKGKGGRVLLASAHVGGVGTDVLNDSSFSRRPIAKFSTGGVELLMTKPDRRASCRDTPVRMGQAWSGWPGQVAGRDDGR